MSTISILQDMVSLLITNTAGTFQDIFSLFGELLLSAGVAAEVGGPLGFGLSLAIVILVGYFLARFFLNGGKMLIFLFLAGLGLLYIAILGSLV